MAFVDDIAQAWGAAAVGSPADWSPGSLRCSATGLAVEQRSDDRIAVAVGPDGGEREFRAAAPVAALAGLARDLNLDGG